MKNLILIFAMFLGVGAFAQPRIVKKHNLKLQPTEGQLPIGVKAPKIYTGKWGNLIVTSKGKYLGWVVDSTTNDTTFYQEKPPGGKNAMRVLENGPGSTPDVIEVPQDLLDKEPQQQPQMQRMGAGPYIQKSHSIFYILPYYEVQQFGSVQAVVDWAILQHNIANQIIQIGGVDIPQTIAEIYVFPNPNNWLDSLLFDSRIPNGLKPSTIIRYAIEKIGRVPGTHTQTITTIPLSMGGVGYRNPTLQRYGSSSFVNANRFGPSSPYPYSFGPYCMAHEGMTGHSGGLEHSFECKDKTDPEGRLIKVDSSYNQGVCQTVIVPSPIGLVLSYQHIRTMMGGGIVPRWHPLEKSNLYNYLAVSSHVPGIYLGAPALKVDSLRNKDDRFTLRLSTPANINAQNWELRENGRIIQSGTMAQTAFNLSMPMIRANGNYRYVAWIWNSSQRHSSDSFTVVVNRATVTQPCTYSAYGPCRPNGTQRRTGSRPDCSDTIRSCTYVPPVITDGVLGPVMHYTQNATSFFRFGIPLTGDWRYEVAYCRYDGTMNPPDSATPPAACGIRNALNFSRPTAAQLSAGQINLLAITQPAERNKWYRVRVRYRNGASGAIFVKQSAWFWW